MSNADSDAICNIDIQTVDPSALADITNVKIDVTLPKRERILDFIMQIKNPYCYKCGKTIVKTTFSNTERTLEEIFKNIIADT